MYFCLVQVFVNQAFKFFVLKLTGSEPKLDGKPYSVYNAPCLPSVYLTELGIRSWNAYRLMFLYFAFAFRVLLFISKPFVKEKLHNQIITDIVCYSILVNILILNIFAQEHEIRLIFCAFAILFKYLPSLISTLWANGLQTKC